MKTKCVNVFLFLWAMYTWNLFSFVCYIVVLYIHIQLVHMVYIHGIIAIIDLKQHTHQHFIWPWQTFLFLISLSNIELTLEYIDS